MPLTGYLILEPISPAVGYMAILWGCHIRLSPRSTNEYLDWETRPEDDFTWLDCYTESDEEDSGTDQNGLYYAYWDTSVRLSYPIGCTPCRWSYRRRLAVPMIKGARRYCGSCDVVPGTLTEGNSFVMAALCIPSKIAINGIRSCFAGTLAFAGRFTALWA